MKRRILLHQLIGAVTVLLPLAGCGIAPPAPQTGASAPTPTSRPAPATTAPSPSPAPSPTTAPTASPIASPTTAPTASPTLVEQRGELILEDYRLNIECLGQGSPTVMLDGSGNGAAGVWKTIHPAVASSTRTCIYFRQNLPPEPLTSQQIAQDIRNGLHNMGITGPYVLASWSAASLNTLLFASQYPDEVGGIVLVDPTHPDTHARYLAALPLEAPGEPAALTDLRNGLKTLTEQGNAEFIEMFQVDLDKSMEQARATGSLGDRPLIVLTARKAARWPIDIPEDVRLQLEQAWWDMHEDLAQRSSNSKHIEVEKSNHCIPCDQPEIVTEMIYQVIEAVRSGTRVPAD